MSWPLISLNQICDTQYGYTASADDFKVGPKYLRITDIASGPIDWESVPYCKISESDYPKYKLNAGDIIIARTGNTTGYARLIRNNSDAVFASYLVRLKIKSDLADSGYIGRLIESDMYKDFVRSIKGGAAQGNANAITLTLFKFRLPPIEKQRIIASILSTYDDLINTNRRHIQLLEESARLLFREWFVYFKFPSHEKVNLTDRGGRNMPVEWEYLPFTKIKIFKKAPLGVPVFTDTRQYYQTSEIDGTSITGKGEEVDYESRPSRADIAPRINTVYFAKMKDTDKVLYFNKGNSDLLEKILLSTGMVGFTTEEKYLGFLFGLLTSYEFVQYKNNFATGATQVSLNDASLKKIKVLLPTLNLVELYSEIVNPLLEECSILRSQNQKLTYARDILLPRLMSGAIEV